LRFAHGREVTGVGHHNGKFFKLFELAECIGDLAGWPFECCGWRHKILQAKGSLGRHSAQPFYSWKVEAAAFTGAPARIFAMPDGWQTQRLSGLNSAGASLANARHRSSIDLFADKPEWT
jgi:hypothetical protein